MMKFFAAHNSLSFTMMMVFSVYILESPYSFHSPTHWIDGSNYAKKNSA